MTMRSLLLASTLPALALAGGRATFPAMVLQNPDVRRTTTGATTRPPASSAAAATTSWSPASWRTKEAKQIPTYPDPAALAAAERLLARSAPLVFAGEVRKLSEQLAAASQGKAFVVFGEDCAESFDEFSVDHIR